MDWLLGYLYLKCLYHENKCMNKGSTSSQISRVSFTVTGSVLLIFSETIPHFKKMLSFSENPEVFWKSQRSKPLLPGSDGTPEKDSLSKITFYFWDAMTSCVKSIQGHNPLHTMLCHCWIISLSYHSSSQYHNDFDLCRCQGQQKVKHFSHILNTQVCRFVFMLCWLMKNENFLIKIGLAVQKWICLGLQSGAVRPCFV